MKEPRRQPRPAAQAQRRSAGDAAQRKAAEAAARRREEQAPAALPETEEAIAAEIKARGGVGAGVATHQDEAEATAIARGKYTPATYDKQVKFIYGLLAALLLSVVGNIYLGSREPEFRYFSTDAEGGFKPLQPLDQPMQPDREVLNWATRAITKSWTLSFAKYQEQLQEIKLDYTSSGWESFMTEITRKKNLDTIVNNKYVTSVVPYQAPVVVARSNNVGGRYGWKVQLPIYVTYESAGAKTSQVFTIEATIVRRPESENPSGLGIAQIIAK